MANCDKFSTLIADVGGTSGWVRLGAHLVDLATDPETYSKTTFRRSEPPQMIVVFLVHQLAFLGIDLNRLTFGAEQLVLDLVEMLPTVDCLLVQPANDEMRSLSGHEFDVYLVKIVGPDCLIVQPIYLVFGLLFSAAGGGLYFLPGWHIHLDPLKFGHLFGPEQAGDLRPGTATRSRRYQIIVFGHNQVGDLFD